MTMVPQFGLIYAALGIASALFSYFAIPPLMPLMRRYALARPNARSSHTIPTPQGGGIPIVLALVIGLVAAVLFDLVPAEDRAASVTLALASLALALLGLVDDIRPLPVLPRLAVQFGAATALMLATPADVTLFHGLMPLVVERAIVVIALVWMINLTNFMDGIDWIAVSQFVPMAIGLVVVALLGLASPVIGIVAGLLAGGLIGFAPYNRPVAKLFLGDVGSLPIGLVAGYALYRFGAATQFVSAIIIALYPLSDATLTLLMRLKRHEKIWVAHRSHFYQRATQNGSRVMEVVRQIAVMGVLLAGLALSFALTQSGMAKALLGVLALLSVAYLLRRFTRPR